MLEAQKVIIETQSKQIEELCTMCNRMSENIQNITTFMERATRMYKEDIHTLSDSLTGVRSSEYLLDDELK